jgi:hypothetical protein
MAGKNTTQQFKIRLIIFRILATAVLALVMLPLNIAAGSTLGQYTVLLILALLLNATFFDRYIVRLARATSK